MEDADNILTLSKIDKIDLQTIQPVAHCIAGNMIGFVASTNQLFLFNFETNEKIEFPKIEKDAVPIMSIAINEENTMVATGHSDGRITFWSIQSKSQIYSSKTETPVSKLVFCQGSNTVVHTDITGNVYSSTLNIVFIYKKSITTNKVRQFDSPISALSVCKKYIFLSCAYGTYCLDSTDGFKEVFTDTENCNSFAFYKTELVGRSSGENLIISDFQGKNKSTINFDHNTQSLALISPRIYASFYNGKCEVINESKQVTKPVPVGKYIVDGNHIFIAGAELHRVFIDQTKEDFNQLVSDGKWKEAFNILKTKDEIKDIESYINMYIESANFEIPFLFETLERLLMTDFVTDLKITTNFVEILIEFAKIHPNWKLNLTFIEAVSKVTKDPIILHDFLDSLTYNASWAPSLINISLRTSNFDLAQKFANNDVYLSLLIAEYSHDAMVMHEKLKLAMESTDMAGDAIKFLSTSNLKLFLAFDTDSATDILQKAFDMTINLCLGIDALVNNVIEYLKPENPMWPLVITTSRNANVFITSIDSAENYLLYGGDVKSRKELFSFLLTSGAAKDYQHFLDVAIAIGFEQIELDIIGMSKDLDSLVAFFFRHKKTSFIGDLHIICKKLDIKQILMTYWRELMTINSFEFCAEILNTHDLEFISRVIKTLETSYKFMSIYFTFDGVMEVTDQSSILKYIELSCDYNPKSVIEFVRKLRNSDFEKIVAITEQKGVLDATLHICGLLADNKRIVKNSINAITDELMESYENSFLTKQVIDYLCSAPTNDNLWYEIITAFQLPFMKHGDKFSECEALISYITSMTYNINDFVQTTKVLTKTFSFLPFAQTKKLFQVSFATMKEKNKFSVSLNAIVHEEAINNQLNAVRSRQRGVLYDGTKCAICMMKLDGTFVCCHSCGSCYHSTCCHSWCEKCRRNLGKNFTPDEPSFKKIQKFDLQDKKTKKMITSRNVKPLVKELTVPKVGIEMTRLDIKPEPVQNNA